MPDGAAIRRARVERGWTQAELAERALIGERDLAFIEDGERPLTSAVVLYRLATELGTSMAALMTPREKRWRPTLTPAALEMVAIILAEHGEHGVELTEMLDYQAQLAATDRLTFPG